MKSDFPSASNPKKIGSYPALVKAGGGLVWDEVLEYRVWCCPSRGAADLEDGNDYYYAFESYEEALAFSQTEAGAKGPLALILQKEYLDEPEPGQYIHVSECRLTEWPVEFLKRPKRTASTIPDFLSPDAPKNRLEIIRGNAV